MIFGCLRPEDSPISNFKMKGWLEQELLQKTWIQNGGFYPETPISVKFSNLNNIGSIRSWGLKFSGINYFNTIYKIWGVRVSCLGWFDMELPNTQNHHTQWTYIIHATLEENQSHTRLVSFIYNCIFSNIVISLKL